MTWRSEQLPQRYLVAPAVRCRGSSTASSRSNKGRDNNNSSTLMMLPSPLRDVNTTTPHDVVWSGGRIVFMFRLLVGRIGIGGTALFPLVLVCLLIPLLVSMFMSTLFVPPCWWFHGILFFVSCLFWCSAFVVLRNLLFLPRVNVNLSALSPPFALPPAAAAIFRPTAHARARGGVSLILVGRSSAQSTAQTTRKKQTNR